jgi:hypothetical protein
MPLLVYTFGCVMFADVGLLVVTAAVIVGAVFPAFVVLTSLLSSPTSCYSQWLLSYVIVVAAVIIVIVVASDAKSQLLLPPPSLCTSFSVMEC